MDPAVVAQIKERVRIIRDQAVNNASEAANYLVRGEYSSAAAEAHRAHQRRLVADELESLLPHG